MFKFRQKYETEEKPSDIRGFLHLFFGILFPIYVIYFERYNQSVYHNIYLFSTFSVYMWSGLYHVFDFSYEHIFQRIDYINIYLYLSSKFILHTKYKIIYMIYKLCIVTILLFLPLRVLRKIKLPLYVITALSLTYLSEDDYSHHYEVLTCGFLTGIFYACNSQYLWYKNLISNHDISHIFCICGTILYYYKQYHN
jgi:hypothetical protein